MSDSLHEFKTENINKKLYEIARNKLLNWSLEKAVVISSVLSRKVKDGC